MKILCICLSPSIQRTLTFDTFKKGAVNRSRSYTLCAGGKAVNSSRVLEQLEKDCSEVLCPAGIENKEQFLSIAHASGLTVHPVFTEGKTRECWTVLADGTTTEIICEENVSSAQSKVPQNGKTAELSSENAEAKPAETPAAEIQKKLLNELEKLLPSFDAVIFAGSCPAFLPQELPELICSKIKKAGKILLADFKGKNLLNALKTSSPDFIKINEKEFAGTFGVKAGKKSLCTVSSKYKTTVIVTRGEKAVLCAEKDSFYKIKPEKIKKPVNTTGCGDSFNAGFLYEYSRSKDLKKSLELGNRCAALNARTKTPGDVSRSVS